MTSDDQIQSMREIPMKTKPVTGSIEWPSKIPSGLELDPDASAKRTAEMQQLAEPHQGQVGAGIKPTRNLTIIWDDEKQAMLERIQELETGIVELEHRIQALEARDQ